MAEPTYEELLDRIKNLERLVTTEPKVDPGPEYSFPVVNQGINTEEFQLMSRAAGSGVYVQHDASGAQSPYRLVGMPGGDAETNSQNKMILKVASVTHRSEAAIQGFFHRQTEDIPVEFPPVTTPTTYRLCLTLDPRDEKKPGGPLRIRRYDTEPPVENRRKHIVLWTVHREPNQLLTDATIVQTNPWIGHVINVWSEANLPDPTSVEYGTLAMVIRNPRSPEIFTNRGVWGWIRLSHTDWEDVTSIRSSWVRYSDTWDCHARGTPSGAQVSVVLKPSGTSPGTLSTPGETLFRLPPVARPPKKNAGTNALIHAWASGYDHPILFRVTDEGNVINLKTFTKKAQWLRFSGEVFYV